MMSPYPLYMVTWRDPLLCDQKMEKPGVLHVLSALFSRAAAEGLIRPVRENLSADTFPYFLAFFSNKNRDL